MSTEPLERASIEVGEVIDEVTTTLSQLNAVMEKLLESLPPGADLPKLLGPHLPMKKLLESQEERLRKNWEGFIQTLDDADELSAGTGPQQVEVGAVQVGSANSPSPAIAARGPENVTPVTHATVCCFHQFS